MTVARLISVGSSSAPDRLRSGLGIKPVLVLQVVIFLIAIGNVGRIPFLDLGERTAPILINDVCLGIAFGVGLVSAAHARSLRLNDVAITGLVFAAVGGLITIAGIERFGFSTMEVLGSLAYLARWLLYFSLYIVIINCVRARDTESLWRSLEMALILIVAFGVVQAIFLPDFAFMVFPEANATDWDAQRHRLVSTILDPNLAAAMIGMVLLVQIARLASGAAEPLWKPLLLFAGLLMTLSRGGLLSFVIGCFILLPFVGLSKRVVRFAAVVLVLFAAALPKIIAFAMQYTRFGLSDESAMARVVTWERALGTFLDYPLLGIGFNTYAFVQERRGFTRTGISAYSAEGGLLFVAVLTGLVGLGIYLAMVWFVLRRSRRAAQSELATPAERGLLLGTIAATIAILFNSIFANSLMSPWGIEVTIALWGIAFVIASDLRTRGLEQ